MLVRSRGIVLHALRYGDQQVIVDVYTEAVGAVAFMVRVPRSGRRGLNASLWQPLAFVEIVWEHRPNGKMSKPKELTLWQPWRSLTFHPYKVAMSLFIGEFLYHALRSEQENVPLFDYLAGALQWFDECDAAFANFHVVLLVQLTRFLGFVPNVEGWQPGMFFDLQAAMFVGSRPSHPYYLEPLESALVPKFLRMDFRSMRSVGLNGSMRRRALELVILFYHLHVPEFPELRSLAVLAEVFS